MLDQAENPLGILQKESTKVGLKLGYRYLGFKNKNNSDSTQVSNGFIAPDILIGSPKKIYLNLSYNILPTRVTYGDSLFNTPLNYFGLAVVGQIPDGRFQAGLFGTGYYAKEKDKKFSADTRVNMGVECAGLTLGTKLHEAVTLAFAGHVAGFVDSLQKDTITRLPQERSGFIQLPQIDVILSIGKEKFPYLSSFVYTYARNHFVYTQKKNIPPNMNPDLDRDMHRFYKTAGYNFNPLSNTDVKHKWDADPIVTDSIGWDWQNLFDLPIQDAARFQPGINLGYWHSRNKRMKPGGSNQPMKYDGEKRGFTWENSSLHVGVGISMAVKDYVDFWIEYNISTLRSKLTGDSLSNKFGSQIPKSKPFNQFGLGLTTNLNSYPAFKMPKSTGLYLTFGFLFIQENNLLSKYRSNHFALMYPMKVNTQLWHYEPWESMKHDLTTAVTSIGLGLSLLDKMFILQTNFGIMLSQV
jgi:opacity protein-like surface antigen